MTTRRQTCMPAIRPAPGPSGHDHPAFGGSPARAVITAGRLRSGGDGGPADAESRFWWRNSRISAVVAASLPAGDGARGELLPEDQVDDGQRHTCSTRIVATSPVVANGQVRARRRVRRRQGLPAFATITTLPPAR
jgi:hypothetical protein